MDGMTYEDLPRRVNKKTNKRLVEKLPKKLAIAELERLSSSTIVWYIIKRHRVVLMFNLILFENMYLIAKLLKLI